MSVGLYDDDLKHQTFPNLELMKLSTYYKRKRELVSMAPFYTPEKHSIFYCAKDYDDGCYPQFQSNVNYIGRAYGDVYSPMDLEIEKSFPDVYLYERAREISFNNKFIGDENYYRSEKIDIGKIYTGIHLRLSLDGKTIWEDYESQINEYKNKRYIMFYDYNLADISNAAQEIEKILSNCMSSCSIAAKFPIITSDSSKFYSFARLPWKKDSLALDFHGILDDEILAATLEIPKVQSKTGFYYYPFEKIEESENLTDSLLQILYQLIFLKNHNVKFLLKYEDEKKVPIELVKLFELFRQFAAQQTYNSTFYRWIKDKKIFQAKEVFYYMKNNHYDVFKEFYECNKVILKNGRLINERDRNP